MERTAIGAAGGGAAIIRPQRLGTVVMVEIIERIARGELPKGALLPTETELQTEFGVSRTALREGLKAVEERGMIAIRQGRGAVVLPVTEWNVLDPFVLTPLLDHHPTPEMYEQLNAFRMMLEPDMARLAAARISEQDLGRLAELLTVMATEFDDPDAFLEHDLLFHSVIADAAGNLLARAIMTGIEQPLRSSRRLTNRIPRSLEKAQESHSAIHRCLAGKDGEGAAAAMREHLSWSHDRLLGSWEGPASHS
ncbi:FadR/GntR family transcriptional regulator [Streptomyces sp. CA-111067]|uniref:FadR/GntR family transcriptional regulator n=1 Tax=Streptomyces sp. CA-111067 TaxID=3240046 RepID=UPI003D97DB2F